MVLLLFQWWYGAGWKKAYNSFSQVSTSISRSFSVPILIRTLFAPWRRIGGLGGKTIGDKLRSSLDNLISRFVGFTTRCLVLIAAGLIMLLATIFSILLAIVWPLVPVLIVYCLVRSVTG